MREVGYPEGTKKFYPSSCGRVFCLKYPSGTHSKGAQSALTINIYSGLQTKQEQSSAGLRPWSSEDFWPKYYHFLSHNEICAHSGFTVRGINYK